MIIVINNRNNINMRERISVSCCYNYHYYYYNYVLQQCSTTHYYIFNQQRCYLIETQKCSPSLTLPGGRACMYIQYLRNEREGGSGKPVPWYWYLQYRIKIVLLLQSVCTYVCMYNCINKHVVKHRDASYRGWSTGRRRGGSGWRSP